MQNRRITIGSALLHLGLLALLLYGPRMKVVPTRYPGTDKGSHISLIYSPGRAQTATSLAALKPAPSKAVLSIKTAPKATPQAQANVTSPAAANPNAAQGGDALGSGNVTVAFATFFPPPHPDLNKLRPGTRGDVIIDVTIDEHGRIVETQVAQSMGDAIDQTVLATIQDWTFKPATKDGLPVPSQQELLFHYERS